MPLILGIDLYVFSWLAELLSQKSDVAVLAGLILGCVAATLHYFLIKYLYNNKSAQEPTPKP